MVLREFEDLSFPELYDSTQLEGFHLEIRKCG